MIKKGSIIFDSQTQKKGVVIRLFPTLDGRKDAIKYRVADGTKEIRTSDAESCREFPYDELTEAEKKAVEIIYGKHLFIKLAKPDDILGFMPVEPGKDPISANLISGTAAEGNRKWRIGTGFENVDNPEKSSQKVSREITEFKQALRYNEGKTRFSLLDFDSFEGMLKVLDYGAKKYTKILPLTIKNVLSQCQFAQSVIEIVKLNREDFVRLAMIGELRPKRNALLAERIEESSQKVNALLATRHNGSIILANLRKQKENTSQNIDLSPDTESEKKNAVENVVWSQGTKSDLAEKSFYLDWVNTESPKIFTSNNVKEVAKYAEVPNDFTLITVIQQENTEEFFAVNATTESDCLMIALTILEMLSFTCNQKITPEGILLSGSNNWKKGLPTNQIFESMLRHLTALQSGEEEDSESGLHHTGHVLCNAMFLAYMYQSKREFISWNT